MLSLALDDFAIELKEGSVKNVGPPNKRAEAKLYDVTAAEAREFGDRRVKLVFGDESGNEVHVALSPEEARTVASDIEAIAEEGSVFE